MEALLEQLEATSYNPSSKGYNSLYYQPDRVLISSDQAIESIDYIPVFSTQEEFFSEFQVRLPRPALEVKSIQLVRASIPNVCPNIPDTETVFWYYRIPAAEMVEGFSLADNTSAKYLKFVRLLPSWYKPELNNNSHLYGFNRTFQDYQDLAAELAKSCANDPLDGYFKSTPAYQNALAAKTQAEQNYNAAVATRNAQQAALNQAQAAYNAAVAAQAAAQAAYDQAVINEANALAAYNANPFDPALLQAWLDSINARIQAETNLTNANIQLGFTTTQLQIAQQNFNTAQAAETAAFLVLAQAVGDFQALTDAQGFIQDDISITYNAVSNKFEFDGLNAYDDDGDVQFYYISCGYNDRWIWSIKEVPIVPPPPPPQPPFEENPYGAIGLTNQSALHDGFGWGVPPQPYQDHKTLNLRLGFTWNGNQVFYGQTNPEKNPFPFRMRPIPALLNSPLINLQYDDEATIYTAESYANLVNTGCVNIYIDLITGSTTDTLQNTNLLAAVPMNASNLGVSFYNPVITNPLTKIIGQIYDISISLRTETGEPFYLPNSAIASFELAFTY